MFVCCSLCALGAMLGRTHTATLRSRSMKGTTSLYSYITSTRCLLLAGIVLVCVFVAHVEEAFIMIMPELIPSARGAAPPPPQRTRGGSTEHEPSSGYWPR